MPQIFGLALPFFGLIFVGYLAAKFKKLSLDGLQWMNFFIVYIALPALFFNLLSQTPIEKLASWSYIFTAVLGTYCTFAIAFCVGIFATDGDVPESTIQGLAGAYGNIGYMGVGLSISVFGVEAAVPAALIFCFDNTLHFIMAPLLMAVGGKVGDNNTGLKLFYSTIKAILLHPFIVATMAGIAAALVGFSPPVPIAKLLEFLMNAAAPCALFAMGVTIALVPAGKFPKVMGVLVPIKLILHPLIVYLLLSWVGNFDPVWVYTAVIMASLPSATNVFVIAQQYDVWVARSSSMVLITTIFSVFTVTGLLYLMDAKLLPPDLFP